MGEIVNQIIFLGVLILTQGLAALFQKPGIHYLRFGSVIVFSASMLNFIAFSEFISRSVEGQAIGLLIIFIILIHLFVQKSLRADND